MSLFSESVPTLRQMLKNLDGWLEKAEESATARGFDVDTLTTARLAPDMFALARQVQTACDTAKFAMARLAGREAPKHEDDETTIAELRSRVQTTLSYIGDFTEADFEGAEERELFLGFLRGASVMADDYLREFAVPNFFFHVTMVYAILRHNGVPLGKHAYIGHMTVRPAPTT